jgi:RND family efflux transporter MFP subunit
LFAFLLLTLSLTGCGGEEEAAAQSGGPPGGGGGGPPPPTVRVEPVRMKEVEDRRRMPGNLRPKRRAQIAVVEPGRVVAVEFDEAQDVAEGDVLIRLDDRRLREDLAQAEAQIAVAEAAVLEREADLERLRQDLSSNEAANQQMAGAVSELDLRQARTAVAVGEAQRNAAEKQVAAARTRIDRINVQLEDTVITAPFDGRVVERMAELGEYLSAGDAVGEMITTDIYEAVIDVPESVPFSAFSQGSNADVTLIVGPDESRLTPIGLRVVPDIDPRSRRFQLIADVESTPEVALSAGMSATADVPVTGRSKRMLVPSDALLRDGAGFFVYGTGDGPMGTMVFPIGVTVEYRVGDDAVISGDLGPGMNVVVEGGQRLRPGQPVQIAGENAEQPPQQPDQPPE